MNDDNDERHMMSFSWMQPNDELVIIGKSNKINYLLAVEMSLKRPLSSYALPPTIVLQLSRHGFTYGDDVTSIAASQLAKELGITPEEALKLQRVLKPPETTVRSSKSAIGSSAYDLLQQKHALRPIYTMCEPLDRLLGGGVPSGEVTEFCGVPGIGKTQIGIQVACNAQIPSTFGGVDGQAVYIDTEGSFLPERAASIAQGLVDHLHQMASFSEQKVSPAIEAMTARTILQNIHVYRVYDYTEQLACIRQLPKFIADHPRVRVVVLDSVAFHFRRGFDDMALRSRLLTGLAQELLAMAKNHKLAVVLINQVTTKISGNSNGGDSKAHLAPALGESWAHSCTNRLVLHWDGSTRIARLIKSPSRPPDAVPYIITQGGVRPVESSLPPPTSAAASSHNINAAMVVASNGTVNDIIPPTARASPPAAAARSSPPTSSIIAGASSRHGHHTSPASSVSSSSISSMNNINDGTSMHSTHMDDMTSVNGSPTSSFNGALAAANKRRRYDMATTATTTSDVASPSSSSPSPASAAASSSSRR